VSPRAVAAASISSESVLHAAVGAPLAQADEPLAFPPGASVAAPTAAVGRDAKPLPNAALMLPVVASNAHLTSERRPVARPRKPAASPAEAVHPAARAEAASAEPASAELLPATDATSVVVPTDPAQPVAAEEAKPPLAREPEPGAASSEVSAPVTPVPASVAAPSGSTKPVVHEVVAAAPSNIASRLTVELDRVPGGVSKASLRGAINQSAVARCYKVGEPQAASATLEVATNMAGRIISARVAGESLPLAVRECIEQVARSGQIRNADAGEVHATFSLKIAR
jgi:hypothetical protein